MSASFPLPPSLPFPLPSSFFSSLLFRPCPAPQVPATTLCTSLNGTAVGTPLLQATSAGVVQTPLGAAASISTTSLPVSAGPTFRDSVSVTLTSSLCSLVAVGPPVSDSTLCLWLAVNVSYVDPGTGARLLRGTGAATEDRRLGASSPTVVTVAVSAGVPVVVDLSGVAPAVDEFVVTLGLTGVRQDLPVSTKGMVGDEARAVVALAVRAAASSGCSPRCLALPCFALLCLALPCFALLCLALPCFALLCLARLLFLLSRLCLVCSCGHGGQVLNWLGLPAGAVNASVLQVAQGSNHSITVRVVPTSDATVATVRQALLAVCLAGLLHGCLEVLSCRTPPPCPPPAHVPTPCLIVSSPVPLLARDKSLPLSTPFLPPPSLANTLPSPLAMPHAGHARGPACVSGVPQCGHQRPRVRCHRSP